MNPAEPPATQALIAALPESAGSALYGMVDVLAATGTLWRQLVGEKPGAGLIRPRIVGSTQFTLMFFSRSSAAMVSVMRITALFDAAYAPIPAAPFCAAYAPTLTIFPPP